MPGLIIAKVDVGIDAPVRAFRFPESRTSLSVDRTSITWSNSCTSTLSMYAYPFRIYFMLLYFSAS